MTIAELLKARGVDEDTINGILEDMKSNKIFTASEENLDIRYGKLKTDHEGKLAELTEAQNLIAELKKSNKGNEGLQQKITDYEGQVAQLQAELEQTKLDAAIQVELLAAKALAEDVDYLIFKLKEKGELALDENGKIKSWDDKLAGLKTQFPNHFEKVGGEGENGGFVPFDPNRLGHGKDGAGVTKEQFRNMSYEQRVALKQQNEELYRQMKN